MAIRRVFLGWGRPCLHLAVDWLERQRTPVGGGGLRDLSELVVVTPGRRAGRRLLELLVERAEPSGLLPPRLVTVGQLPELLYTPDQPVVGGLEAKLLQMECLRGVGPDVLGAIMKEVPGARQWGRWMAVADQWAAVVEDLAGQRLTVETARHQLDAASEFCDFERWDALAILQRDYEKRLKSRGWVDIHMARAEALAQGRCAIQEEIVLVSVVEMGGMLREMLRHVADRVTALVYGPEESRDDFDDFGALNVERWAGRSVSLASEAVRVVDQPADQAAEVLQVLAASRSYAADEITVGVGDAGLGPMIQRQLERAGVPARIGAGQPVGRTRPGVLLAAAGRYLNTERFDELATLLRHPDLERYLMRTGRGQNQRWDREQGRGPDRGRGADRVAEGVAHWLTLLERYLTEHCQAKPTERWLGNPLRAQALKRVYEEVKGLLAVEGAKNKSLVQWSSWIAGVLGRVYGQTTAGERADEEIVTACQEIFAVLEELTSLTSKHIPWAGVPGVEAYEAIEIVLHALGGQSVPQQDHQPAVELLGWLELPLDDAGLLVVTGFNEGCVPRAGRVEVFLPQSVRQILGLPGRSHRHAHDAWALSAMAHSGREVVLIAGRRGSDGQPLLPSRLLLAGKTEEVAGTILRFYGNESDSGEVSSASGSEKTGSKKNRSGSRPGPEVSIPQPIPQRLIISPVILPGIPGGLPVTAFRDYLQCPYRFYFKHVLKIKTSEVATGELDQGAFGTVAHEVLRQFGTSPEAASADPREIERCLHGWLDRLVAQRYAGNFSVAVQVQVHRLRQRLSALAREQAKRTAHGWRIVAQHVEASLTATLEVDGHPFEITGKIDRVDYHPEEGWCIWDYKTGDSGPTPEKAHRKGPKSNKTWTNLQLPLYRTLAAQAGITGNVRVGYVLLPKEVEAAGFVAAAWTDDEFYSAKMCAQEIIRRVRAGVFWPPGEAPGFNDGLTWLCLDACSPRQREEGLRRPRRGIGPGIDPGVNPGVDPAVPGIPGLPGGGRP